MTRRAQVVMALVYLLELSFLAQTSSAGHSDSHLLGVHPDRKNLYELSSDQDFKCLDGSRTIPRQFVNDDYCDCLDASDEPGTSACPHGQFFCPNQGYIQKLIPSAWVNDGQCDCCDASDEYKSNVSCENTCGVLGEIYREEQERHRAISDQGSAIRSQYKEQARTWVEQNTQLLEQYKRELSEKESAVKQIETELNSDYGPSKIFLPLKGKCYNFKDREYTYTLCMFERAAQESTSGMQTELGRWAGWGGPSENPYNRQRYEGGMQCWNGPTRSAVINISCGVEDKITSVTEPSKCEYVYDFITPAACPDLDPPETQETQGEEPISHDEQSQQQQANQDELKMVEEDDGGLGLSDEPPAIEKEGSHDEL